MLEKFIEWAKNYNWNIALNSEKSDLPDSIKNRYNIPRIWFDFICNLRICENQFATKCFLTLKDYFPKSDGFEGFQWNEFELQSLEFAYDENQKEQIISYWNTHLPIILSVDGGYSYYAIDTENGSVVSGYEPEYEESTVIADDFNSFIENVISGKILL